MKTTTNYVLFCSLLLTTIPTTAPAADQFAKVTNPGWTNSSQYSWTGAWGDYDNDGFIDLFVPNSTSDWNIGWPNFLYHNNHDGTFTRKSAAEVGSIASDKDSSLGGYWGDFNNDAYLDLFVINFTWSGTVKNRLYLNRGNGTFTSLDAGDLTKPFYPSAWGGLADYDNDGVLDAFVCAAWSGHRTNLLFHGRGDGTFSAVTNCVVATDKSNNSNDAAWGDFDNDGDMDLILANWDINNLFYRNDGGGQFTRLTNSLLAKYISGHNAWGDYDNDGFLDLACGSSTDLRLFQNIGGTNFVLSKTWGIYGTPAWTDYDNDGYLDLILFRGQGSATYLCLFHNNGDGTFTQVQDAFTRTLGEWLGGAWGDYDNDGFMDLFVAEDTGKNALYHNLGNTNHWIKFRLQGTAANRTAIGAKIRVKATIGGKTVWQMREVLGGNCCQNDLRPNFGLADATNIDQMRIEWPSGTVQEYVNVAINQFLTLWEPPTLSAEVRADGTCELSIKAETDRGWQIQASSDLLTWQTLTTVTNTTVEFQFTDTAAAGMDCRFYQVKSK
jgi:hypothetical protein